jgi:hypothetical protein
MAPIVSGCVDFAATRRGEKFEIWVPVACEEWEMQETKFSAQLLIDAAVRDQAHSFEMTFVDAEGNRLVIGLPLRVAADALIPVLHTLSNSTKRLPGQPTFSKNVVRWRVGRSSEAPQILFQMNDDVLYGMHVGDAKKFSRQLKDEAEIIARRPKLAPQ